jgi:cytochrome oxidase assembly protein ShyY1
MSDIAYLAAAYAAMICLIGWFTWQLLDRLKDVQERIEAVEGSLSNPTDSDE